MNKFDDINYTPTNALDVMEFYKHKEAKEKKENYYKEKPIEQNTKIIQLIDRIKEENKTISEQVNKLEKDASESKKSNLISNIFSFVGIIIAIISLVTSCTK